MFEKRPILVEFLHKSIKKTNKRRRYSKYEVNLLHYFRSPIRETAEKKTTDNEGGLYCKSSLKIIILVLKIPHWAMHFKIHYFSSFDLNFVRRSKLKIKIKNFRQKPFSLKVSSHLFSFAFEAKIAPSFQTCWNLLELLFAKL